MGVEEITQERIALNQATFRDANERIEHAARTMELDGPTPFICECADRACVTIVQLPLPAYEAIRTHPRRFFNAPGHEAISVEAGAAVVLEQFPDYIVLEKIGVAGAIAEEEAQHG